jgi:hypothetical protein
MVIRPTFTYTFTVKWPSVEYKTSRTRLSKLQRLACQGVIGAIRMAPTVATDVSWDFLLYISRWRLRPRREFIGSVAINNGSQNPCGMGMRGKSGT